MREEIRKRREKKIREEKDGTSELSFKSWGEKERKANNGNWLIKEELESKEMIGKEDRYFGEWEEN